MLGFKEDDILSGKTAQVKTKNRFIKTIQNTIKIWVYTTYPTIAYYMIL
jgi:hypothetical protein